MAQQPANPDNVLRPSPRQGTPFLGRERELSEVLERLTDPNCRLLSLIGPGGIGKTRLAIEVASSHEQSHDFPDGVHLVQLQSVTEGDFLASTIAEKLGIGLSGTEPPSTQVLGHLSDKQLLLILDNMEQLTENNALNLLVDLIQTAPKVKLLVTSRQALRLRPEWRYQLLGMPVPEEDNSDDAETFDAVRLFITCAKRVQPDFNAVEELKYIVRVCRLAGGNPLAIELAAGWRRTMDSRSIAGEIEQGLDILRTELRDVPERHRSMRAVFDHTWRSLDQEMRSVFSRLSVFRGGFDRSAADQVADASLSTLTRLVDQSLLQFDPDQRYNLHELLRQYGEEKLDRSPSQQADLRRRHAKYYTAFLHQRLDQVQGPDQRHAVDQINIELQNVRAAWSWAVSRADEKVIHQAATPYFLYCQQKCTYLEGAEALARAASSLKEKPSTPYLDRTNAQLRNHEGWLRIRVGEFEKAKSLLELSCSFYESQEIPPPPHMGGASEVPLALVAVIQGDLDRAISLAESARQSSKRRGDQHNLAFAHYALSAARLALGEYEDSKDQAQRSAEVARSLGNRWFLGYPLNEWGKAALALGNRAEARRQFQSSFAIKSEFNDAEGMAVALNHLGETARLEGQLSEAYDAFDRSLRIYRTLNDHGGLATSYRGLARVALDRDKYDEARDHFLESVRIANGIHYLPLVYSLLVDVAPMLRQLGECSLAIRLLSFVQQAPASNHEARMRAAKQLKLCEQRVTPEEYHRELQQGGTWDLDAAISTLQTSFANAPIEIERPAPKNGDLIEPLTAREREVLALLAEGLSNAQIAEELVLAVGTVKWYASEIYGKLGVSNRTEAAARARELEII